MSTLLEIPGVRVEHLPTIASDPLPLADGLLILALLPPSPTHPAKTVTLTVGSTSFPLSTSSRVMKVNASPVTRAHATYVFSPASGVDGPIGQVRITMKESATPGEYEATEALARIFESTLNQHKLLHDDVLHSDTRGLTAHNWGETAASAMVGAASTLAAKITSFTDSHVTTTTPFNTRKPPVEAVAGAYQANIKTAQFAETASEKVNQFGNYVQEGGKKIGNMLPEGVQKTLTSETKPEDKSDFRKVAEEGWNQFATAAKGVATAVGTVGAAVSDNTHKAVEHGFGKEADAVAKDLGQAGSNVAGVGLDAVKATSVIIQGGNVATGVTAGSLGQQASVENAQATNSTTTETTHPPGHHGKPLQVFSDEKQKELLKTAIS